MIPKGNFKAIVTKTTWYWHKNKQRPMNRTESPEKNKTRNYSDLIFSNGAKDTN
jgi:hypothetical protein